MFSPTDYKPMSATMPSLHMDQEYYINARDPFQYLLNRIILRYRYISKPRDLCLELSAKSEIWHARGSDVITKITNIAVSIIHGDVSWYTETAPWYFQTFE